MPSRYGQTDSFPISIAREFGSVGRLKRLSDDKTNTIPC